MKSFSARSLQARSLGLILSRRPSGESLWRGRLRLAQALDNQRIADASDHRQMPIHFAPIRSLAPRSMLLLAVVLRTSLAFAQTAQVLPAVRLNAGIHNIEAMVAASPDERATGLMYRRELPAHAGMLFVFDEPAQQCFWMKNTLLPLSAAFVADDGKIVNIADMQPQTLETHCSTKPVRYVLEMNQGWFAKRGIQPGAMLGGTLFKR